MNEERRTSDRRRDSERRADQPAKKSISTLVILATLSTAALITFFVYESGINNVINWNKLLYMRNKPIQDFQLGGVELGMNPELVESKHPNLDLTSLVRGEKIAIFKADGARYTVWFVAINGREKAYRIRYDQIIKGKTESDIIEDMGRRHGKPGTSDCTKGAPGERRCHFQWWPSGGISLNVLSTTEKRDGKQVTGVTIIATDTYLDGKRIRNLQPQ